MSRRTTDWRCPECGDAVQATGPTERSPLHCRRCDISYRHPRLALLLSLALPGLGSFYLRRWLWGGTVFLTGTGAFAWAIWRLGVHLAEAWNQQPDLTGILQDASLGTGLLMLAYAVDVLVVWLLGGRLRRL